ncbi:MAG: TetR/AcrR family transcriptional regulator [Marinifilaceae bacterium]|jgi:AcrR family transcriptional regulator|nr:TetR/AcrR family transcriptional regulator [Marinifilaceae bacterium]
MKVNQVELKNRIKSIAFKMIVNIGLKAFSMDKLAHDCRISKSTLYKIVETKEKLIEDLSVGIFEMNAKNILEPLMNGENPKDSINEFHERIYSLRNDLQSKLIVQIFREFPSIENKLSARFSSKLEKVIQNMNLWKEKSYIEKDTDVEMLINCLRIVNEYQLKNNYPDDKIKDTLIKMSKYFFSGILTK